MVISFLGVWTDGDRGTDTVLESSYGNMSTHKKFQLITSGEADELLIFICLLGGRGCKITNSYMRYRMMVKMGTSNIY